MCRRAAPVTPPTSGYWSVKYVFFDSPLGSAWPTLQPFVKLPVANPPIGSGKTDLGPRLLANLDLPADFGLDLNADIAGIAQPSHGA